MIPICFASVVRSIRAMADPLTGSRTGQGRVTTGLGATVVTSGLRFWVVPLGTLSGRPSSARRIVPGRWQRRVGSPGVDHKGPSSNR
ncbi:hypothetical protein GCM10009541_52760 [Micromonospora gifhornensis]|uniref:Secreted protein n=1 Tax=Micromonospora gifhornensis TaxID=84594 RepID=A0ABQ4IGG3_9ACTN|nr:hypothetical protein Vgi01_36410 [Micromonospora gifhornensis]